MRVVQRILIVLGHALALLATAWRAALARGPIYGVPGWRPEVVAGITVTALLAMAMLVCAWKAVQGRASLRSDAVGLFSSALGLGNWVSASYALCAGPCRASDGDAPWVEEILFPAPLVLMTLCCGVLAGAFLRRLWRRSNGSDEGRGSLASVANDIQVPPTQDPGVLRPLRALRPATAVLVGAAVANGMGYASSYLASMAILLALMKLGMTAQEAYQWTASSWVTLAPLTLVGLWGLAFGGYWTARLRPMAPLQSAFLVGLLLMALTLVAQFKPFPSPEPLVLKVVVVLMCVPGCLLGAWWARRSGVLGDARGAT